MRGVLAFALIVGLAGCGGGGGGAGASNPPQQQLGPGTPPPSPSQSPDATATPSAAPSGSPTAAPIPSASPVSMIANTTGRVGLFQEFDKFMAPAQIQSDASRYDAVWGAMFPQMWLNVNPSIVTSRYFIPQEDRSQLSGRTLSWWQSNHPDWILYACQADGTPTHDYAYWSGVTKPDVPLDFHNPAVVDYQVRQLNGADAIANGDRALAIDQVIFEDAMIGGNPNFGQRANSGEYACGVWQGASFVRRYNGVHDPAWTADMIAFVRTARQIVSTDPALAPHHMNIIVNHPLGSLSDANEQALLGVVDGFVDERGYGDYGRYATPADANMFFSTTQYLIALQRRGIAVFVINYFKDAAVTVPQREYALAASFMANEGALDTYITASTGGIQSDFPEYAARLGTPCEEYHGGPNIYYRRYSGGLVVLNSGSLPAPSVNATLPSSHSYVDIDGRPVPRPLAVASNDGYILTTTNGCS